jgi:hypothetical protein
MKQPKGELTQEEWCNPWDGNGFAMPSGFDHDVMMYDDVCCVSVFCFNPSPRYDLSCSHLKMHLPFDRNKHFYWGCWGRFSCCSPGSTAGEHIRKGLTYLKSALSSMSACVLVQSAQARWFSFALVTLVAGCDKLHGTGTGQLCPFVLPTTTWFGLAARKANFKIVFPGHKCMDHGSSVGRDLVSISHAGGFMAFCDKPRDVAHVNRKHNIAVARSSSKCQAPLRPRFRASRAEL